MPVKPSAIQFPVSFLQHSNAAIATMVSNNHLRNVIRNQLPLSLYQRHAANTTTTANIHHHHSPTVTASEFQVPAPRPLRGEDLRK